MKWLIGFLAFMCLMGTAYCFHLQQQQIKTLTKQVEIQKATISKVIRHLNAMQKATGIWIDEGEGPKPPRRLKEK